MLGQHESFIAGFPCIHIKLFAVGYNTDFAPPFRTIAAIQDNDAIAHIPDITCKTLCRWRLACTAYGNIPEADHITGKLFLFEEADLVACKLQIHQLAVNHRKNIQHRHKQMQQRPLGFFIMNQMNEIGLEILHLFRSLNACSTILLFKFIKHFMQHYRRFP